MTIIAYLVIGNKNMARAFSKIEKERVVVALKKAAESSIMRYGIRKTSIDELVKEAGIAKGSFYTFYTSKEVLFFDVINGYHNNIQNLIIERVKQLKDDFSALDIAELLFESYKQFDNPILIRLFSSGEMEYLMRKLPDDIVAAHQQQDDMALTLLLGHLAIDDELIVNRLSAALRAVFLTIFHKREIGEEYFDDVLKTLLEGICTKYIQR